MVDTSRANVASNLTLDDTVSFTSNLNSNNATSNTISCNAVGYAVPTLSTRYVGTKLNLYPYLTSL